LVPCAIFLCCSFGSSAANADIYKYVDPHGGVHLADRPLGPGYVLIHRGKGYKPRPRPGKNDFSRNRRRFTPLVDRVARHHRLDPHLIHAVVQVESAYDPAAVSRKGAVGLMQLMPGTASRYGVRDRLDPERNLHGGVRYLRDLLVHFDDVVLALAAYNAGENAVERYGNRVPPFPETRRYVSKVLAVWRTLRHERERGS
jgi:soluble lytic murein transglycosylase-like protein